MMTSLALAADVKEADVKEYLARMEKVVTFMKECQVELGIKQDPEQLLLDQTRAKPDAERNAIQERIDKLTACAHRKLSSDHARAGLTPEQGQEQLQELRKSLKSIAQIVQEDREWQAPAA